MHLSVFSICPKQLLNIKKKILNCPGRQPKRITPVNIHKIPPKHFSWGFIRIDVKNIW